MQALCEHLDLVDQKLRNPLMDSIARGQDHRPQKLEFVVAPVMVLMAAVSLRCLGRLGFERFRIVRIILNDVPLAGSATAYASALKVGIWGGIFLGTMGGLLIAMRPVNPEQTEHRSFSKRTADLAIALAICGIWPAMIMGLAILKHVLLKGWSSSADWLVYCRGSIDGLVLAVPVTAMTTTFIPYYHEVDDDVYA